MNRLFRNSSCQRCLFFFFVLEPVIAFKHCWLDFNAADIESLREVFHSCNVVCMLAGPEMFRHKTKRDKDLWIRCNISDQGPLSFNTLWCWRTPSQRFSDILLIILLIWFVFVYFQFNALVNSVDCNLPLQTSTNQRKRVSFDTPCQVFVGWWH